MKIYGSWEDEIEELEEQIDRIEVLIDDGDERRPNQ